MKFASRMLALLVALPMLGIVAPSAAADAEKYRAWAAAMKESERGPFSRLRWFCADGTVHPPNPYPCRERGGGNQHGEWSARTAEMRENGYYIANLLAGIDPEPLTEPGAGDDRYAQMLIERYLMATDNGWILRKALFYRGAIQEEDEREGGKLVLETLAGKNRWAMTRYAALRAGANLLPHGADTASAQQVRTDSAALHNEDPAFGNLRAKIHGAPDGGDAERVRDYARRAPGPLQSRYQALADLIDRVYQAKPLADAISDALPNIESHDATSMLQQAADNLRRDTSPAARFAASAKLLADIRDYLPLLGKTADRAALLDLSLKVERDNFASGNALREALPRMSRRERIGLLRNAVLATYGAGLLKKRERDVLLENTDAILAEREPSLTAYREFLQEMGRAPGWGTQNLRFLYFESMQKLAELEPHALLFVQDQLRGSPLLLFSNVVDGLARDANRLRGIRHKLMDDEVGTGLKALNPGLAYGVLHSAGGIDDIEELDADGIYLIPETVSELPPIAGILTQGEGNPLSHVQLLARNLGIPNVSIDDGVAERLRAHDGRHVMLAVSPGGLVEIVAADERPAGGEASTSGGVVIRPEPEKLRLGVTRLIPLDELRASDSGVTVGPKAAKLGGLRAAFPGAVSRGVAIPFGRFKFEVLDRPYRGGPRSVYDWMKSTYGKLDKLSGERKEREAEAFRAELYDIILNTEVSDQFRADLREAMAEAFGSTGVGVFVRSDTNVEDLPGFTGAGLNLTLPNVIGYDELVKAIGQVWASPFTRRAFAWRQSHMVMPEHVYTSILLLESVASDKSGVLVTADLETGDQRILSVAVNEGLGGAVDGQAAETLRIDTRDGSVKVLSTATAPWYRVPSPQGGIAKLPATGADTVLQPDEIRQLITFARKDLHERFPEVVDDDGNPAPADVEFGFVDGQLRLFQIRPFLQNRNAAGSEHLAEMDRSFRENTSATVDLGRVPGE